MKDRIKNIIDVVDKISDLNFQKDVWLNGLYWDRVSSLEEAVNTLDDYRFFTLIHEHDMFVNSLDQLVFFCNNILEYNETDVSKMLVDPVWLHIVHDASNLVILLKNEDCF